MSSTTMILTNNNEFDFNKFVEERDYVGALTLLDSGVVDNLTDVDKSLWMACLSSRLGKHNNAKDVYLELLSSSSDDVPKSTNLFLAIAYLYLGQYNEAEHIALSNDDEDSNELKTRILLQVAAKTRCETKIAEYRQMLSETSKEDKLASSAVDFSIRHRYEDCIETYKSILAADADNLALYVYSAMALFKMGLFEESLQAFSVYTQANSGSAIAANLQACCAYHLRNKQAALEVLDAQCDIKTMNENDLVRHNSVVFKNGERALQILPGLVDQIPEARTNLAVYYLKKGELDLAAELINEMDADSPHSHLVLGILHAELAKSKGDLTALQKAKAHFGNAEEDTLMGRQAMAQFYFLNNQFEDAIVYLESIEEYMEEEEEQDTYHINLGISLAATGKYKEGLSHLLSVSNNTYKSELEYSLWLIKCYIMTNNADEAWECYLQTEDEHISSEILQLIGNDCYKLGGDMFLFSARAFHELLKMDSYQDYTDGLLGSSVGVLKNLISGETETNSLLEVVNMLEEQSQQKCQDVASSIQNYIDGKCYLEY